MSKGGEKHDQEKLRYELVPPRAEEALVAALTYGAMKYEAHGWRKVEEARDRYYGAMRRHLAEMRKGNLVDEGSGLPHAACLMACAAFLAQLDVETMMEDSGGAAPDYDALIAKWVERFRAVPPLALEFAAKTKKAMVTRKRV